MPTNSSAEKRRSRCRIPEWVLGLLIFVVTGSLIQCTEAPGDSDFIADAATPSESQPPPFSDPVGVSFPANETFIRVSKNAMASVVNISSTRQVASSGKGSPFPFFDDPFFRRFFGEEFERRFRQPRERKEQGLGSGVIVSSDGYIVTNNHVVNQADKLMVLLGDKRKMEATLVGTDPKTDLAVIKVEADGLPTLPWGDSNQLQVGEVVLAVGNPFGLNQTVTMGIISAVGRANMGIVDYEDFIQTDAAINPGNSGGALVNLHGELIGINTAIFSRTGGYMGIGFAIPSHMVQNVMKSLIGHGKVIRGWLGVSIQELTSDLAEEFGVPDTSGALVSNVVKNSPAAQAGIKRRDVIRTYRDISVKDATHLRSLVAETSPGTQVPIGVIRNEKNQELSLTIVEMPKDVTLAGGSFKNSPGNHALTGVVVEPLTGNREGDSRGVRISRVKSDSPANRAGLRVGDIILELNRTPIETVEDYQHVTQQLEPKSPVLILLKRGSGSIYLSIRP